MKRSTIEKKLNEAMQSKASAEAAERSYTREVEYHDRMASETRKDRQKARNRKDRAEASIARLTNQLLQLQDGAA